MSAPPLQGQRVLVTGASSGIGRAVAQVLAAQGAELLLHGRDLERLEAVRSSVLGQSPGTTCIDAELAQEQGVQRVLDRSQGISALVHAAGEAQRDLPLARTGSAELRNAFSVHVEAALQLAQGLRQRWDGQGGAIVFVSSNLDRRPLPGLGAYSLAKAAESQLVRSLAREWGPERIRVNAVCPGLVRTPATSLREDFDALRARFEAQCPLGRIGEPEDVAQVVAFLLGDGARWVSGQCWDVDGGAGL